jgi:outer membrane biosynthesis protein TonB
LTQSEYPVQELKRKRPKTHWIWYIGTITASLIVGVSIAFAMQQTNQASGTKETTKTTVFAVNHSPSIAHAKLTTLRQPAQQVQAKPVPATETKAPVYSTVSTNTNETPSPQPKQSSEQKKQTAIVVTRSKKPNSQIKPSSSKESKPNPPKESPQTITPETPVITKPDSPIEPPRHKGPIIRIVDRVTNTVQYLLTGKTK